MASLGARLSKNRKGGSGTSAVPLIRGGSVHCGMLGILLIAELCKACSLACLANRFISLSSFLLNQTHVQVFYLPRLVFTAL